MTRRKTRKKTSFRSINHKADTFTRKKIAIPNRDDKEIQDKDGITTCPHGSNISFIKQLDLIHT